MKTDEAVSNVMGVVLIICLVVILTIVIITLVFGNFSLKEKSAYVLPGISNGTFSSKNVIVISHRGGDPLSLNVSSARLARIQLGVYIDTATNISSLVLPVNGSAMFQAGDNLYIYNTTSGFRMTTNSTSLADSTAGAVTTCPLTVRLVDETAKVLISKWNWTDCAKPVPTGPAPTVTSLNSTTGYRGWPAVRVVTGTNFLTGATALFNRSDGAAEIPASGCVYVSSTQLICTFDFAGKTPSPPLYHIVVTNPDGKQGMRKTYFNLTSLAPTLTSSTPSSGKQGTTVAITRLLGNYFQPDSVVTYNNASTSIGLTNVRVVSMTNITGTLVIPSDAPVGPYSVTVTNPSNSKSVTKAAMFTVTSNAPTVTSMNSTTGYAGWINVRNISGTNFQSGATASLTNASPAVLNNPCTYISSTVLTCSLDLRSIGTPSASAYTIVVTNPDGKQGMKANYFTITSTAPTVSSSVPSSAQRGTDVAITSLTGSNFQAGTTVTYWNYTKPGEAISLQSVTVVSRSQITGTLPIPSGAVTGPYNITVTNPDGKSAVLRSGFTMYANAKPTVGGITPGHGKRGTSVPVTITGTGFLSGARVRLYDATTGGYLYLAPAGTVTSTQITTSFAVGSTVPANLTHVRVTNTDGQYATLTGAYQIDA